MTKSDNNTKAFLSLVRVGLWADVESIDVRNCGIADSVDWNEVYMLAAEQSVLGLALQGVEVLQGAGFKIPQMLLLQWIGEVQIIEQRNEAMNGFVAELINKLRKEDVYCLLAKGQGVAQCYEKPLWRASGDIDLLLCNDNYSKALECLVPIASNAKGEVERTKHRALTINGWEVELHGTLRSGLWRSLEATIDEAQDSVFYSGSVRSWMNGQTQIFLPGVDEDVYFIFTHILQHFYKGGIGLRQICDWCRLLWTYKDSLDRGLLESRIRKSGLMSEWKAFGSMTVNMLGMPEMAMPFYTSEIKWKKKADRIMSYILETGNFGHNRDVSYQKNTPVLHRKFITMWRQTKDNARHFLIFPKDSIKAWWSIFVAGMKDAVRGK